MFAEEVFGPAAAIAAFRDDDDAVARANASDYGLGASVWSEDLQRAESIARRIDSGSVFVNGMVKSDPRLPVGGVKQSGLGRELSRLGIHEFTNAKTLWVA
jgi:acyl-CoA reductase-like NAD-dependent aldehyde dehydrogenase